MCNWGLYLNFRSYNYVLLCFIFVLLFSIHVTHLLICYKIRAVSIKSNKMRRVARIQNNDNLKF